MAEPTTGPETTPGVSGALDPSLEPLDQAAEPAADAVGRARDSLESTLSGLKLTPEEERAMAEEIRQLRELGRKLDESTIEIAAFGMVSRGKSSVLNALLGRDVFEVGATHGTTTSRSAQRWEQGGGALRAWDRRGWCSSTRRASTRSAARSARPWPVTSRGTPT